MSKVNIADEVRRITNETASAAAAKALEVAEQAKQKAAEVSSLAISKALDASTLAATKAADAASAAATIAASTSKDLEYIKADISSTKLDIKEIKEKLDSKYTTKEETSALRKYIEDLAKIVESRSEMYSQFSTVKSLVYGLVGLILIAFVGGLITLVLEK